MLRFLLALLWLAPLGTLARAGGVTTTTTTIEVTTTSTTLVSTTSTTAPTTSTSTTSSTTVSTSTSSSTSTSTSTSSSSTSSTSTTVTTSTSTTTLPLPETCGNCLDDDGDGQADFEDADCCVGIPEILSIERLTLRSVGAFTQLTLAASPLAGEPSLSPPTHRVFVQLAPEDGPPVFCARIDPVHFRGRRTAAIFTDRSGGVPGAGGITSLRLQRQRGGPLRLKLRGERVGFASPPAGTLRVAVGLQSLVAPGFPTNCASGTGQFD